MSPLSPSSAAIADDESNILFTEPRMFSARSTDSHDANAQEATRSCSSYHPANAQDRLQIQARHLLTMRLPLFASNEVRRWCVMGGTGSLDISAFRQTCLIARATFREDLRHARSRVSCSSDTYAAMEVVGRIETETTRVAQRMVHRR